MFTDSVTVTVVVLTEPAVCLTTVWSREGSQKGVSYPLANTGSVVPIVTGAE